MASVALRAAVGGPVAASAAQNERTLPSGAMAVTAAPTVPSAAATTSPAPNLSNAGIVTATDVIEYKDVSLAMEPVRDRIVKYESASSVAAKKAPSATRSPALNYVSNKPSSPILDNPEKSNEDAAAASPKKGQ